MVMLYLSTRIVQMNFLMLVRSSFCQLFVKLSFLEQIPKCGFAQCDTSILIRVIHLEDAVNRRLNLCEINAPSADISVRRITAHLVID